MAEPISAAYMHWPHSTFTLSTRDATDATRQATTKTCNMLIKQHTLTHVDSSRFEFGVFSQLLLLFLEGCLSTLIVLPRDGWNSRAIQVGGK